MKDDLHPEVPSGASCVHRTTIEATLGFAQVVEGMEVVRRIHDLPTSTLGEDYVRGQMLDPPLRIERASRE